MDRHSTPWGGCRLARAPPRRDVRRHETIHRMRPDEMPPYVELILPTIQAVSDLGQSAKASEITQRVVEALEPADEVLAVA
jgi:hypothetical protein